MVSVACFDPTTGLRLRKLQFIRANTRFDLAIARSEPFENMKKVKVIPDRDIVLYTDCTFRNFNEKPRFNTLS